MNGKPISARNKSQQTMIDLFAENDLLFALGPAWTGKTYIAIALAVKAWKKKMVKRIILSRQPDQTGEKWGLWPGRTI